MKGPSFASGRVAVLLSKGLSVGYGTICRLEGTLRLSERVVCRSEGPLSIRGASVGQISPPSVKNIFLVRWAFLRLTEVFLRSEGALNRSVGSSLEFRNLPMNSGPSGGFEKSAYGGASAALGQYEEVCHLSRSPPRCLNKLIDDFVDSPYIDLAGIFLDVCNTPGGLVVRWPQVPGGLQRGPIGS